MVSFFTHIPFVVNHTINATLTERLRQHPLFFTMNHTNCKFFVWRLTLAWPLHPGHSTILLQSESQAACAQSFALWYPATIEIIRRNLSIACSRYIYNGVAHPVHGESHNQRNTTREVATILVVNYCMVWFILYIHLS